MVSRRSNYAIRAMLHMARKHGHGPVSVEEIASLEGISRKFLEAIMLDLKVEGLLLSSRGKGGGYTLQKTPAKISIGKIVRAVEGRLELGGAAKGTDIDFANTGGSVAVNLILKELQNAVIQVLDGKSLEDLQQESFALAPNGGNEFTI